LDGNVIPDYGREVARITFDRLVNWRMLLNSWKRIRSRYKTGKPLLLARAEEIGKKDKEDS
jgi:hypothetical protein